MAGSADGCLRSPACGWRREASPRRRPRSLLSLRPYRAGVTPDAGETACGLPQHLLRLAEREPNEPLPQLGPAEEARAGHRCNADLLGEPERKLVVRQIGDRRAIGQHVIRALGRSAGEARVEQCAAKQVAPGAVVAGQTFVILPTQRLETHRDRLLEWRRRAHVQKV